MYQIIQFLSGTIILIIAATYLLACAGFTSWLASTKGYGGVSWFFLGLFFGVFAFFSIGFAPDLRSETDKTLQRIHKKLSDMEELIKNQKTTEGEK